MTHGMTYSAISCLSSKTKTALNWSEAVLRIGVADGTRTRDSQDHNLVLYQLNYSHHAVACPRAGEALSILAALVSRSRIATGC